MKNTLPSFIGQQFLIKGRVQGVFYRRFAKNAAAALEITGWTRNLPNGDVEIQAFGTVEQLAAFYAQLRQGPPAAKVLDVIMQPIAWEQRASFEIKQ